MKQRTYLIVLEPEEGGGYVVTVPALPGCFTQGLEADGEPVPEEHEPPRLIAVTVAA